jgi:hypothetical protein
VPQWQDDRPRRALRPAGATRPAGVPRPAGAAGPAAPSGLAQDALLNLLLPFWQVAIGLCVLAAVVVVGVRLARRGPSRVTTALALSGGAVVGICALGLLLARL